jgi:hypothetical protein
LPPCSRQTGLAHRWRSAGLRIGEPKFPVGLKGSAVGFHLSPHDPPGLAPALERAGNMALPPGRTATCWWNAKRKEKGRPSGVGGMRRTGPADATQAPLK